MRPVSMNPFPLKAALTAAIALGLSACNRAAPPAVALATETAATATGGLRMDDAALQAIGIRLEAVQASQVSGSLRAPGEVLDSAYGTTLITPRVESLVVRRHAKLGDEVRAGAPLVTLSIKEGTELGQLQLWSGHEGERAARQFKWKPGGWHRTEIVITTSVEQTGKVLASIDGDALEGLSDVAVYRPRASDYRPKWGLYRGTAKGLHPGEDWVEHRNVSARRG